LHTLIYMIIITEAWQRTFLKHLSNENKVLTIVKNDEGTKIFPATWQNQSEHRTGPCRSSWKKSDPS